MFNLVMVGKEWASPVYPHPLKCKGCMCIHYRVRLAVFFRRKLPICTTVFPHPITFWTRLMFNLVRVGKEWAGPVFPHPLTSTFRFYVYSWLGKVGWAFPHPNNHMHNSFSQLITFCIRMMFNLVRVGKEWAGPVFPHPLTSKSYMCIRDRVSLAELFPTPLTICTTLFPHPITFWIRLMFNLVREGKEWAGPIFSSP